MGLLGIVTDFVVGKFLKGNKNVGIATITESADPKTAMNCFSPGIEINPANGENLVFTKIKGSSRFLVSIGGINQNIAPDTDRGERRIYAVSSDGETIKAKAKFKNDGTLELNGATDSAVLYAGLQTAYDEIQTQYNDLISRFAAWTPVPSDGGAVLKALLSAPPALSSTGDITASESADVKLS